MINREGLAMVAKTLAVLVGTILAITGLGEVIVALFFQGEGGQLLMGAAAFVGGLALAGLPFALSLRPLIAAARKQRRGNP